MFLCRHMILLVSTKVFQLTYFVYESVGLHNQTSDQDLTWDRSDHSFVNISSEGNSGMDQEIKPFRGKLPSMDPCLCCYRFYSHEEEN